MSISAKKKAAKKTMKPNKSKVVKNVQVSNRAPASSKQTIRKKVAKSKSHKATVDQSEMGLDQALDQALAAEPRELKMQISLKLDSDIYMELKRRARAGEAGGRYQTLLNKLLREIVFGEGNSSLEKKFADMENRLRKLNAIVSSLIKDKDSTKRQRVQEKKRA